MFPALVNTVLASAGKSMKLTPDTGIDASTFSSAAAC